MLKRQLRGARQHRWGGALVSAVMLGFIASGLVAGGAGSAVAHSSPVTITIDSGQHPETTSQLVSAFEVQTGIHVTVRNDDEDVLAQEIATEGSRAPADVFISENSPALEFLDKRGLLSRIDSSTLRLVPAAYSSARGDWVGVSARVSVIVYNTAHLKASQVPNSILDLAKPQWAGKLAIAPGETDFQPIIISMEHRYGATKTVSWLKSIAANGAAHNYPNNETLVSKVNSGEAWLGIVNHYYWFRLRQVLGNRAMHSALHYLAPGDPGYVLDYSGAAVLRASHQSQAAQRFVAFLVSKKGEEIIAHSNSFEYPIGSGVPSANGLKPFSSLQPAKLTPAELGDGSAAVALLQRAGLL